MAEENCRAMLIAGGEIGYMFSGILNLVLIVLFLLVLGVGIATFIKKGKKVEEFEADT